METFYECIGEGVNVKAECRLKSPEGGWWNVEGRCRNMLDEEAIDGILIYLRDVTETKERSRRFESIFNGTFQFTGLLEPDGTVVEANEAALAFSGVNRDVIVGERFYDTPWWSHSETVQDNVQDAIEQAADGEFVRYETEARGADGLATIDFSVKPVTNEDGDVSLLVVEGRDITTQQQHRRHLEVMQRVMRHNMRNDLSKIRGWTEMMAEESDPDTRAQQFGTLDGIFDKWEGMIERMKQIRQVLESQGTEGTRTVAGDMVEDAVTPVREAHDDLTVLTDVSDAASVPVPATVREAVRELAENAANAPEAGVVEVGLTHPEDEWLEIGVRDDGAGIPEMEADVLETGEETPLNHGEGLGLWMVRMIVTQAGGEVSVESTADGTAVCLRLPVERAVTSAPQ